MPVIKVRDLAYGRLRAPDLDVMEEFLTHFGLIRSARTPTALYMRGTDPRHHLHVTEKGAPAFVGFAYQAAGEEDLARVAKAPGASPVESIDEPGGGKRVRLREPNGYQIEVVWGLETLPAIPVDHTPMMALGSDADDGRAPFAVNEEMGTSIAMVWTLKPASPSKFFVSAGGTARRSNTFRSTKNGSSRWPANTCELFGSGRTAAAASAS